MPVHRTVLATDGVRQVERVRAEGLGDAWGPVHESPNWRWVLPGTGGVQLRSGPDVVEVDELTAFRLAAGERYQLRHPRERTHDVFSAPAGHAGGQARAWLLAPREIYRLMLACHAAHGNATDLADTAVRASLAAARPVRARPEPRAVAIARALIRQAPSMALPLEALGEEARSSPFHLARLFRRELGLPPHQYRLHLRLALALARLRAGERDLAGLAFDLGFSSQSHFGALFRREVGVTPQQARRALCAGFR